MPQTFATADIGSNTVHLLIAQTDGKAVVRLDNQSHWLGLGEAVAETGAIDKEKLRELVLALASFKKLAGERGASMLYVFATEAVRKASNHKDILTSISEKSRIDVQIISPQREAELAIRGAMLDSFGEMPTTFFDVGGGSAQIVRMDSFELTDFHSLPLGTGTLRSATKLGDVVTTDDMDRLYAHVDDALEPVRGHGKSRRLVGGGGVARGVLRALHPDRDRNIERFETEYLERSLIRLTARGAARRFSISTTRSRTLLPGIVVINRLLAMVGLESLLVSEFGIREGAVLEMAEGKIKAASP